MRASWWKGRSPTLVSAKQRLNETLGAHTGGTTAIAYIALVGIMGNQGNSNDGNHAQFHQRMLLFEGRSMAIQRATQKAKVATDIHTNLI
jgi:hypothetical protein